jgi:hypothetical protein
MRLLEALASAFFSTFGITQPTETTRRRAAWLVLVLLVLAVVAVGASSILVLHMLRT